MIPPADRVTMFSKSHGSGRVGSVREVLTNRVGLKGFQISRVGSGRVGSGRVGHDARYTGHDTGRVTSTRESTLF